MLNKSERKEIYEKVVKFPNQITKGLLADATRSRVPSGFRD